MMTGHTAAKMEVHGRGISLRRRFCEMKPALALMGNFRRRIRVAGSCNTFLKERFR